LLHLPIFAILAETPLQKALPTITFQQY